VEDELVHAAAVAEPDLDLGRMDIDVHRGRVELEERQ